MAGNENLTKIPCTVEILRNADSATRSIQMDCYEKPEGGLINFVWGEGNFACDCNRMIFFCQDHDDEDDDIPCSIGLFSVRLTNDHGKIIYSDGDWPEPAAP